MASPKAHEDYYVRRPDNIKPADKHLYPHIGGIFHDNVPKGKEAISMHGYTDDATPPVQEVNDADGRVNNSAGSEEPVSGEPVLHERTGKAGADRK